MAKYLRPRRGSQANAIAQKILLKKGEMFLEFPESEIGKGPGRLVIGDGATQYQNMDYATTATNVFRPFITDPEIFIPRFTDTEPSSSEWSVDAGTAAIAKMGNGSSTSTVTLPTIIGAIKETLCKHADSITKLNNDLVDYCPFGIGAIYMSVSNINPSTIFPNTTWVAWGTGRVPVGIDTDDTKFNTVEKTGGVESVTLTAAQSGQKNLGTITTASTSKTLTGTLDMADNVALNSKSDVLNVPTGIISTTSTTHNQIVLGSLANEYTVESYNHRRNFKVDATHTHGITISGSNATSAHTNLQPYITCYMWKRTA